MLKKILAELILLMDRQRFSGRSPNIQQKQDQTTRVRSEPVEGHNQQFFKLGNFQGFIFDMDGLVLDTEPTYFAAWQQAITKMGYQLPPDAFKIVSGYHYHQVETQLKTWLGQDFNLQNFKQLGTSYWRKHIREHGIGVKPGVIELLDYAKQQGISVCLATNSWAVYARHCLAIAGLTARFPLMVTGDEVEHVKPAPDIFLKAAERMRLDIQQCVIFEDSHTGILAASASGAYSVYVPSTFPINSLTAEMCDCMLDDLSQVFDALPIATAIKV